MYFRQQHTSAINGDAKLGHIHLLVDDVGPALSRHSMRLILRLVGENEKEMSGVLGQLCAHTG